MKNLQLYCPCCEPASGALFSRRAFLGTIGAGAAAVAVPGAMTGTARAQGAMKTLPIGGLVGAAAHNAGLEMAHAKGFDKANGLTLDRKEYNAGAFLLQAIAAGEVIAGTCGNNPTILAKAQGLDVKIVGRSNMEGSVLIVGPDIKSPKDLNGRKVGTPGVAAIQDTLMLRYEQKNGIKTEHVFMKVTDMPTMLRNKEIAGYIVWEVTGHAGLGMGGGRVLATSHDITPGHECCALVASGKFLRDDPDGAQRLVKTFAQGLKYVVDNPAELVPVVARRDGLAEDLARRALANVKYAYPPVNDPADLTTVVESLLASGKLERKQVPDTRKFVEDLLDNRLVKSLAV
jgi:NitT/TauT family transport system substrate-binding protein